MTLFADRSFAVEPDAATYVCTSEHKHGDSRASDRRNVAREIFS